MSMPDDEVDLHLDAQTVCRVLERVEALASGARLIVAAACSEDRLSPRVGVAAARPLVEELRPMSEVAASALNELERKYARREHERQTEQLAWVVLRAANRTQARGSSVRLIFPREAEVADASGMELTEARLLSVERYLQDRGYVEPANIGLRWGTYTITPAGLRWLEEAPPLESSEPPTEALESGAEDSEEAEPAQEGSEKPWWRRLLGGERGHRTSSRSRYRRGWGACRSRLRTIAAALGAVVVRASRRKRLVD
jgi:hypothetical protein